MIEYHNFHQSVKKYYEKEKQNNFPEIKVCPNCGKHGCCVNDGYYWRYAISIKEAYLICIKIYECKNCGIHISIHPTFLISYRQYIFSVIYQVLIKYFLLGMTYNQVLESTFTGTIKPSYQLIQYWIKSVSISKDKWLGILQGEGNLTIPYPARKAYPFRPLGWIHFLQVIKKYFEWEITEEQSEVIEPEEVMNKYGYILRNYRSSPFSGSGNKLI